MTEKNSTVRGRELGVRLRHYRVRAGLAERGAAAKLGVSTSTICRIERGTRNPTLEEVASLLGYYDVKPAERAPLIDMAKDVDLRGWWNKDPDLQRRTELLFSQESRATEIRTFETCRVPGLLQSELYMSAMMRDDGMSNEEIAARIKLRVDRRHILFRSNPVSLLAYIDELALHRCVGSAAVMHKQLDYLTHLATKQNIIIRIVPSELSGKLAGLDGFHMMKYAEAPTMVLTESGVSELYHEDPQDIAAFEGILHKVSTLALSTGESVELISRLMRSLEDDPDVLPRVGWPALEEEQP